MKRLKQIGFALMAVVFLASCGGGGSSIKEKTIKASGISISGEGSDYIKVVDGDYTLKVVNDKVVIAVKLELTKKYDGKGQPEMGNLNLIPLDKSGVAVPDLGLDFSPATMSDWDKVKDLLKGDEGKQVTISFEWNYFSNKEIQERIMKETESFEITRADFTGGSSSEVTSSDDSSNDESVSSSGSEDWDEVLKSYEEYIDQYIKLLKKANKGDASALSEYPAMMEKATDLASKLENAGNDLTPTQASKFAKLQLKLTNAVMELQ